MYKYFFLKPSDEKRTRSRLLIINFIYFIERNSTKSIYDLCIRFNFNTVDLFVCLGFLVLLENFFTHMETSPSLVKGCKFWPMLGIHAIEQWKFFSVPHLLWYGTSVYNSHLRGPVTLSVIAERLAVEPFMFWRLRSVVAMIWTLNLLLTGWTL